MSLLIFGQSCSWDNLPRELRIDAAEKIREKSRTNETFIPSRRELSVAKKLHQYGHLEKEILEDLEERIVFDKELEVVDASINLPFEEFANVLENMDVNRDREEENTRRVMKNAAKKRIRNKFQQRQFLPTLTNIMKAVTLVDVGLRGKMVYKIFRAASQYLENHEGLVDIKDKIITASRIAIFCHQRKNIFGLDTLQDVDLSSIPANHLQSLAMVAVKEVLRIQNVTNTDLSPIFRGLRGLHKLTFRNQILNTEDTMALVKMMEGMNTVTQVSLEENVFLDIKALTEYSGQGSCKYVLFLNKTADRYKEELTTWAKQINWRVRTVFGNVILFESLN